MSEQAGKELDRQICEEVLGIPFVGSAPGANESYQPFSTQIHYAFRVVKKMIADDWSFELHARWGQGLFAALFWKDDDKVTNCSSESAAHAICLAALKAKSGV